MRNKRIIAVHLLNDFSGSPLVLRQVIESAQQEGFVAELYTATPSGKGMLCGMLDVKYHSVFYRRSGNRLLTLFAFLLSQAILFLRLLFRLKRSDLVYVNTLLPFGAALAGWCRGSRVIYHIHEVSVRPAILKRWLLWVAERTAGSVVFVSEDLKQRTTNFKNTQVVYNALPSCFTEQIILSEKKETGHPFTVLMASSLKKYKGIYEMVRCAGQLTGMQFVLVLNAGMEEISDFFRMESLPANLLLVPATDDLHPWYRKADVVMNLSIPEEWIETFGMTILEAMYYGKPVIVPPVGGVTELVTDGMEGFRIHSGDTETICKRLELWNGDKGLYRQMASNALDKAGKFTQHRFRKGIAAVLYASKNDQPEEASSVNKKRNVIPESGMVAEG